MMSSEFSFEKCCSWIREEQDDGQAVGRREWTTLIEGKRSEAAKSRALGCSTTPLIGLSERVSSSAVTP